MFLKKNKIFDKIFKYFSKFLNIFKTFKIICRLKNQL